MSGHEPYVPPPDLEYNEFVGEIRPLTALGCVDAFPLRREGEPIP